MRIAGSISSGRRSILTLGALSANGVEVALVAARASEDDLIGEVLPNLPRSSRHIREVIRSGDFASVGLPPVGDEIVAQSDFLLAALGMLDRANWNHGSLADQFRLYQRLVGFWRQQLARTQIDACWFDGVPHQAQDWALYQVCHEYEVRTVITGGTIFDGSLVFFDDVHGSPLRLDSYLEDQSFEAGSTVSRYMSEVTAELVDPIQLRSQRGLSELTRGGLGRVGRTLGSLAQEVPEKYPQMIPSFGKRKLVRSIVRLQTRRRISQTSKWLLSLPEELPQSSKPIIHFPLHFQPERTSVPQGLPHFDQVSAIRAISAVVGDAATLIVKEHPQMLKWNTGWSQVRSDAFYRDVQNIPGVFMVSPLLPTSAVLERASIVATLTGTAGYEARLNNATAIAFGAPWYQPLRGVHRVRNKVDLMKAVEEGLSSPATTLTESEIADFVSHYTVKGAWSETPVGEDETYWPDRYAVPLTAMIRAGST